jgi:hypothetical protein
MPAGIVRGIYCHKEITMAKKRVWLGILVMALVFGMAAAGCEFTMYDNSASLYVKNVSDTTYYVKKSDDRLWETLSPDRQTFFNVFWNEGETGSITIYYQNTGPQAAYWTSRSYVLTKNERRNVNIPN